MGEVNFGELTTGLLKHTVAGGISTPATAVPWTDYAPGLPTAAAGGTVDVITATYSPAVTLTNGTRVILVAAGANTTNVTFAPNGLTAKAVVKISATALVAGDIPAANYPCDLEYNGTAWVLLNPAIETRLGGASAPSAAELGYVKGLSSAVQTQLTGLSNVLTTGTDPGHAHTKVTNANTTIATDMFPLFSATQGGDYAALTNAGVKINPSTGMITAPGFTGTLTGTASGNPTASSTTTLTNKRVNPRITLASTTGTPTPDVSTTDIYYLTLTEAAQFQIPTGTPLEGQALMIKIRSAAARALTFVSIYRAGDIALPTTTVAGKVMYLGFRYDATDTKWDFTGFNNNFAIP